MSTPDPLTMNNDYLTSQGADLSFLAPQARPQPGPQPAPPPAQPRPVPAAPVSDPVAKALAEDPASDPAYRKAQAGVDRNRASQETVMAKEQSYIDDYLSAPPPPSIPPAIQTDAPQYRDFAVQAMPWVMMFTALGGKVAKLSGNNMLGAMTGMVEGAQSGQKDRFERAYNDWQENYKRLQEDWKNRMEIYNAAMKWRSGRVDAEAKAVQMYKEMSGEYAADQKNIVGIHNTQQKAELALRQQDIKLRAMAEQTRMKDVKTQEDIVKNFQKAGAAFPRLQAAGGDAERALALLPHVLEKYKNDTNGGGALVPKPFAQWMLSTGDTEVQQFSSFLKSAKPILAALETSGTGSRSNMLLQSMIAETVPTEVFNKGPAEIDQLARNAVAILRSAIQQQKSNIDTWRQLGKAHGLELPADVGYDIPPSELPSAKGKPKPGDIEDGFRFKGGDASDKANWEKVSG